MSIINKYSKNTSMLTQMLFDTFHRSNPHKIMRPCMGKNKYIVVNDDEGERVEEIREIVVHTFDVNDTDDPDIHAAQFLYEWETSDNGKWIMKHAVETPSWHKINDMASFGYKYQIRAKLMGPALTELLLRGNQG
jgi:hypothetical protein